MVVMQTRAVWIGLFISIILFLILFISKIASVKLPKTFYRNAFISFALAVICVIASLVFLYQKEPTFFTRLDISNYHNTESGSERLVLWKKTWLLILEYPWAGVGAGNWQFMYPKNSLDGLPNVELEKITFQRPNNDFLWVVSETGIIGFIAYSCFIALIIFHGVKAYYRDNHKINFFLLFLISGYLGYLGISFFDFPKERIEHLVVSSILLALIISISSDKTKMKLSLPLTYLLPLSTILLFSLVIGYYRMVGEYNMKLLYKYKAQGNWDKVISASDKATSIFFSVDPTSMPVSWYKGLAKYSLNKDDNGKADFQHAYSIFPYNQYILNNLGSAFTPSDIATAKQYYLKAIHISPHFDEPRLNMAALLFNEKKYKEALYYTESTKDSERKKHYLLMINKKI